MCVSPCSSARGPSTSGPAATFNTAEWRSVHRTSDRLKDLSPPRLLLNMAQDARGQSCGTAPPSPHRSETPYQVEVHRKLRALPILRMQGCRKFRRSERICPIEVGIVTFGNTTPRSVKSSSTIPNCPDSGSKSAAVVGRRIKRHERPNLTVEAHLGFVHDRRRVGRHEHRLQNNSAGQTFGGSGRRGLLGIVEVEDDSVCGRGLSGGGVEGLDDFEPFDD